MKHVLTMLSICALGATEKMGYNFLTPKLNVRNYDAKPTFQHGEFAMEWKHVWDHLFETDDEFDDFMKWALKHACKPPKKLAVEQLPYNLLVCAKRCKHGYEATISFTESGRRVRKCKKIAIGT